MKIDEVYNLIIKDLSECETEEEIEEVYKHYITDETERQKIKELITLILEYQYNEKLYGKTKENDDNVLKKTKEVVEKYKKIQESQTEEEIEKVDESERDFVSELKKITDEYERNVELYGESEENDKNFMLKTIEIDKKMKGKKK